MRRCQETLWRIQINTTQENKAGFEGPSSQKKVSLLPRQVRTTQKCLKPVQEYFFKKIIFSFPSESFGSEKGFSHSASGHIWVCMRRKNTEVNEFAFRWLMVNKQSVLSPSVQAHRTHPAAKPSPHFLSMDSISGTFLLLPKLICTMSIHPHPHSFEALVTSA